MAGLIFFWTAEAGGGEAGIDYEHGRVRRGLKRGLGLIKKRKNATGGGAGIAGFVAVFGGEIPVYSDDTIAVTEN